MLEDSPKKR